jgi:flagellum-specific ATP synthase
MSSVVDPEHLLGARSLVELVATYREIEDMVRLGAYVRGHDQRSDAALDAMQSIEELLRQLPSEKSEFELTRKRLIDITSNSSKEVA